MLSRRELLEGAGVTVALAAVGGVSLAATGPNAPMRPPGGQDEDHLLGTCLRCDRCRSVCPTQAIGVATFPDGLVNLRTPTMEFRIGYCDECGGAYKCAQVCPVGSLVPFDKKTDKIGMAVIDPAVCLTFGISGKCSADCVPACPEEALSIGDDGRLTLVEDLCWGCGACEYFCVSDSYGIYEGTGNRGINIERIGE